MLHIHKCIIEVYLKTNCLFHGINMKSSRRSGSRSVKAFLQTSIVSYTIQLFNIHQVIDQCLTLCSNCHNKSES